MSKNISVATTVLNDPHNAAAEIDRVLSGVLANTAIGFS
jgi:TPP-dependent 2-oxoacid decarboxylase